eukprot:GILK01002025.1.p1 GENE.GILK01002025.1~~GILK01002025.1.p1  ORF type:complete len:402 (-),score=59.21 GILK01002025.1:191-1396(-)
MTTLRKIISRDLRTGQTTDIESITPDHAIGVDDKPKLTGWDFYRSIGSPKYVVAPMVDQSELAYRILCRRYGADLAYTPMLNSRTFVSSKVARKELFTTCPEDRPVFAQFAGDEPELILRAAKFVEDQVDAVDLNLGCPQGIAKRGHYGAYLLEEPDLIREIVTLLVQNLKVPVTCKIRLLHNIDDTIKLARTIEAAGCSILTVHGRTKEQKGQYTGPVDYEGIRRVREAVSIPVFANGGIYEYSDIAKCLEQTGCQGVMSSEAILENPALFSNRYVDPHQLAREYLDICETYMPPDIKFVKAHLFKILYQDLSAHEEVRQLLAMVHEFSALRSLVEELMSRRNEAPPAPTKGWYFRHTFEEQQRQKVAAANLLKPKSQSIFDSDYKVTQDLDTGCLFGNE